MKTKLLFISLIFCYLNSFATNNYLSPRNANYSIKAELNTTTKIIIGHEKLVWRNITNSPTSELHFHLYLNAFKNTKSTFMKESGVRHRGFSVDKYDSTSWGWIDVSSFVINEEELIDNIKYIRPDDENPDDFTVFKVELKKPVKPDETISIDIEFTSKLPKIMARTGYSDDYFLVGQWFPKIGVFEAEGQRGRKLAGWNCHQFHANSEFYADYGNYNVDLTIPKNFVIGATGLLQKEEEKSDSTVTYSYLAEDVLDFAWTISPKFLVVEDVWKDTQIRLLIQQQHKSQAERHISAAKNALDYFAKYLGKYPYPSMTIVDPPFKGMGSAGMEYPMFITAGCLWGIPDGIKFTESVVIHELGHNYFMGILASNEFEEAWLDEGFNTYFENRIMDHYYGKNTAMVDLFGLHIGSFEQSRAGYVNMKNPYTANLNHFAWDYPNGGYSVSSYMKPSVVLHTLANLIGKEKMDIALKKYYESWKFKHPSAQDFFDVVNSVMEENPDSVLGNNMDWYFSQTVKSGEICDYKLLSISNERLQSDWGIVDSSSSKLFLENEKNNATKYKSKITIIREGEIKIPSEVLVHFENGDSTIMNWDGKDRVKSFEFYGDSKIDWAYIDPNRKNFLDMKLYNNSLALDKSTATIWKYGIKILFWVESLMTSMFL